MIKEDFSGKKNRLAFVNLPGAKLQFFSSVARKLEEENNLCCLFFSTSVTIRSRIRKLGWTVYPRSCKVGSGPGYLSENEIDTLSEFLVSCRCKDISLVKKKLRTESQQLYDFFRDSAVDYIFVWNGWDLIPYAATYIAKKMGIGTLFAENGYFPFTMQIDPEGVNSCSSMSKKDSSFFALQTMDPERKDAFRQFVEAVKNRKLPPYVPLRDRVHASLWSKFLAWGQALVAKNSSSEKLPGDAALKGVNRWEDFSGDLPEKFIFLPFQVHDDTQLILHSPIVGSDMEKMVRLCYEAIRSSVPDYRIVVKLHPHDINRIDYTDLVNAYPDIIWLKVFDINKILEKATAVITVNSTVGFEALMFKKPVVSLGNNFYCTEGITYPVKNESELVKSINDAIGNGANLDIIEKFLYYCYYEYFAHGTFKDNSLKSVNGVSQKIRQLIM